MTKTRHSAERLVFLSADERGSILVVALIVLCILTAFSVQLGQNVRPKLDLVGKLDRREILRAATQGGAMDGVAFLMPGGGSDVVSGIATIYCGPDYTINRGYERRDQHFKIETVYIDEESKININKADTQVMSGLFEVAAGLDTDFAGELAYCVIDWRDKDSVHQHQQYYAEDQFYRNIERPYEAKDAPFEVLDELLLVRGMNSDIYDKVRDYLTVYGNGKVNVNNASREVLLALGLSESITAKILSYRLQYDPSEEVWKSIRFQSVSSIIPALKTFGPLTAIEEAEIKNVGRGLVTVSDCFAVRSAGTWINGALGCQVVSVVSARDGSIKLWREELGMADSVRRWKARGE